VILLIKNTRRQYKPEGKNTQRQGGGKCTTPKAGLEVTTEQEAKTKERPGGRG